MTRSRACEERVNFGDQSDLPRWFTQRLRVRLRFIHLTPRVSLRAVVADMAEQGRVKVET